MLKRKNVNVSKSQIFQNFLTTSCLIKFLLYPNIIPKPKLFICICNHTTWEAKLWGSKGKSCLRKLYQTHSKNNKYDFCEKAIIANFSKYFNYMCMGTCNIIYNLKLKFYLSCWLKYFFYNWFFSNTFAHYMPFWSAGLFY